MSSRAAGRCEAGLDAGPASAGGKGIPSGWKNHFLILSYDGSGFHGWQCQRGLKTVQGELEALLAKIYGSRIIIHGAGRTDAGVHALAQTASFFAPVSIPAGRLPLVLNSQLPAGIRIKQAKLASPGFHARKSAVSKIYRYHFWTGPFLDPFRAPFVHFVPQGLDTGAMAQALQPLAGRHDFTSFCAHVSGQENRVRTIFRAGITRRGRQVMLTLEADGFLHHMVRNIAGFLLEAGRGWRDPASAVDLLRAKDRRLGSPTAPARGLFLVRVYYRRRKHIMPAGPPLPSPPADS